MLRAELGIEISPAAVAVKRHRKTALRLGRRRIFLAGVALVACALDAHDAALAAGADDGVGLDHRIVLFVDPALRADVGAREQLLEVGGKVAILSQFVLNALGGERLDGSLPGADGAVVERRVVGERFVGNIGDQRAVMTDAQSRFIGDHADDHAVEAPLLEDVENLVLAALFGDEQHALLAFGEHDLVGAHASFALRNQVEFDVESDAATAAHLAGRTGEPGGAHVLNADDRAGLHRLKAGLKQQLFHERIAALHVGPLLFRALVELFAGHGRAVDAVAAGLGADINDGVAGAAGLAVEDLVLADQTEREGVHQRIARIAGLKLGFAAQIRHAEAVAVAGHAADDAFNNGVVLLDELLVVVGQPALIGDGAEAERIHDGKGTRAHRKDVAQNAADAGGRALIGLDVAGVVVRLDLEGAGPAVPDVDDAGVLSRTLHDELAFGRQALEMYLAGLVRAMLGPHDTVDAELGERGNTTEGCKDALILIRGNAMLGQQFRRYGDRLGYDSIRCGCHHDCLYCRTRVASACREKRPGRGEKCTCPGAVVGEGGGGKMLPSGGERAIFCGFCGLRCLPCRNHPKSRRRSGWGGLGRAGTAVCESRRRVGKAV